MGFVNLLIAACLRAAARRWPADIRDDMAREWAAELGMLQTQGGTVWRRLAFAVSLATTPLTVDESGAPHGRWELARAGTTLRTVWRLSVAVAFGFGLAVTVRLVVGEMVGNYLIGAPTAAVMTFYAVLTARWIGARGAPEPGPTGSLGVAATVVLPIAVLIPFYLLTVYNSWVGPTFLFVTACWTVSTAMLVALAVRAASAGRRTRSRALTWGGVPIAAVLSAAVMLTQGVPDLTISLAIDIVDFASVLLPWTAFAVVYGRATVRRWCTPAVHETPEPEAEAPAAPTGEVRWWRVTVERLMLVTLTAGSAVMWSVGMTVLQPLSEPTGPDGYAENNTYWARDLRWGALFAGVLVLLIYVRGDRRATRGVLLGGAAWLVADILLDRIDPGPDATVPLAIAAGVAAIVACAAAGTVPVVARPRVLLTVAMVAAVMAGEATGVESPTDVEPELNVASAAAGSLLALIAIAAAVRAAGSVGRWRTALAVPVGVLAAAGPWVVRLRHPQPDDGRWNSILVLVTLSLLAVVVLAAPRPRSMRDWLRYPAAFAVAAVSWQVLMTPLGYMFIAVPIGNVFTALAGNPAIHSADTDFIAVLLAIPAGMVLGLASRGLILGASRRLSTARRTPSARTEPLLGRALEGS